MDAEKVDQLAKKIWNYHLLKQELEKSDIIWVLGSHDVRVAEYAIKLFHNGWAPLLVFSGASSKNPIKEPGFADSEAASFAKLAKNSGVPEDSIIIEDQSTNTELNIKYTRKLLKDKGVNFDKVILVQKPYMVRRAYATLKNFWPELDFIITSPPISYEEYANQEIGKETFINYMVGDLQRIKEYAKRGFQIPQEIPDDVWQAYEQLVDMGFNQRLIKMKLINFNLWNRNYHWTKRLPLFLDLLKENKFDGTGDDILTFQEVVKDDQLDQLHDLNKKLQYKNEIFFEAKPGQGMGMLTNLTIVRQKLYRFSHNPDDPKDTFPRLLALVELDNGSNRFVVGVTHFAVKPESHIRNSRECLDAIKDFNTKKLPIIICGDFNSAPENETVKKFIDDGFVDPWLDTGNEEFASWPVSEELVVKNRLLREGHPPEFEIEPRRVDYIMTKGVHIIKTGKVGKQRDDIWHSDHWGIIAEVAL